jgi:hypothetical protein
MKVIKKTMEIIQWVIRGTVYVFVPLLLINGFIYFVGAFVALDINPLHWLLITTLPGRMIYTIVNLFIISKADDFWDSIDFKN